MNAPIPRQAKCRTEVISKKDPPPPKPDASKPSSIYHGARPNLIAQGNPDIARGMGFIDSFNWSGATVIAKQSQVFSRIWGTWTVPDVCRPSDAVEAGLYECSVWIGIDGQRRYLNSSLPQVGTTQRVEVRPDGSLVKKDAWCWTQWWARNDRDTGPVKVCGFKVNPGDSISAVLSVQADRKSVICDVINHTTPASIQINIKAPPLLGTDQRQYQISGATAEWIVERPALTNDGAGPPAAPPSLQMFPDFGTVTFTDCFAVAEGGTAPESEYSLLSATYHRLYDIVGTPQRTKFLAKPCRGDATGFSVIYSGST